MTNVTSVYARFQSLYQIERTRSPMAFRAAFLADAGDDQAMPRHAEAVFAADGVADALQFVALKLDERVAHRAVEMVVLRVAVVVLVDGPAAKGHPAEEACFDKFVERAINGGAADFVSQFSPREVSDQFVGVEMVVPFEDMVD